MHGWQPPQLARREGGLWLLDPAAIRGLNATVARPAFDHFYAPATTASLTPWSSAGSLPTVVCTRARGMPLPSRAIELVQAGMCCVLQQAQLWPAAEAAWGSVEYLREGLRGASCNVLSAPRDGQRFSYWFDPTDRVQAGYKAEPLVTTRTMSIDAYLEAAASSASLQVGREGRCLYLQQSILLASADGRGLVPCSGLSESMLRDVTQGIDLPAVQSLVQAGGFGPWQRCQLFIGAHTAGARSILHFDQYDNLFIQIAGTKTLRIFDPLQTRHVYPYPVHHPLDTRAQVDLAAPDLATYPSLREACGTELTLQPGQCLFLPAYWWHEVVTDPMPPSAGTAAGKASVNVSVNFWFAATNRLLSPSLPLTPPMRVELSRQLEYFVADCLEDRARHVPRFFEGLLAALCAAHLRIPAAADGNPLAQATAAMHSTRPADVRREVWEGMLRFVVWKLALLVGPSKMLPFARELCNPERFAALELR